MLFARCMSQFVGMIFHHALEKTMNRLRKLELIAVISGVLCSFPQITGVQKVEAATPRIAGILSEKSTYWQEILQGIEDGCQKEGLSFLILIFLWKMAMR